MENFRVKSIFGRMTKGSLGRDVNFGRDVNLHLVFKPPVLFSRLLVYLFPGYRNTRLSKIARMDHATLPLCRLAPFSPLEIT